MQKLAPLKELITSQVPKAISAVADKYDGISYF